jgi:hypothetical protein
MPSVPKVDQEQVTTAITAGRSVAHGDDTAAAEATVRLARLAGPDAVKFIRRVNRHRGRMGERAAARACIVRTAGGRRSPWRFPFIRDQVQRSVRGTGNGRPRARAA